MTQRVPPHPPIALQTNGHQEREGSDRATAPDLDELITGLFASLETCQHRVSIVEMNIALLKQRLEVATNVLYQVASPFDLVEGMHRVVFGRAATDEELHDWTDQLAVGTSLHPVIDRLLERRQPGRQARPTAAHRPPSVVVNRRAGRERLGQR